MTILLPKMLGFTKLSHFSEMQDDALRHSEGLKGQSLNLAGIGICIKLGDSRDIILKSYFVYVCHVSDAKCYSISMIGVVWNWETFCIAT